MRILKIVLGLLLLFGAGNEFINASHELGTFFSVGVILGVLVLVAICAWLLGSGFAKSTDEFNWSRYGIYFILCLGAFSFFALLKLKMGTPPKEVQAPPAIAKHAANINGQEISLDNCMEGSERMVPGEAERKSYCVCMTEKLFLSDMFEEYQNDILSGNMSKVIKQLSESDPVILEELGLDLCMASVKMEWTDIMEQQAKDRLRNDFADSELKETHDIENYINCLVNSFTQYPPNDILNNDFYAGDLFKTMNENCLNSSLLE